MSSYFRHITIDTEQGINLYNITEAVKDAVSASGISHGIVAITSQHTTTAVTLNEDEERLRMDIRNFFEKLVPSDQPYLHNDIHLRDCDPDEPENAHSHLIAMLFGSSENIAVQESQLVLGQWQSIMLVELDGPRSRQVSVQVVGA